MTAPVIPQHQTGLTLVELMVGLVLGSILMLGMVDIFTAQRFGSRLQNEQARMQENARFALDHLRDYFALAGYRPTAHNFVSQHFDASQPVISAADDDNSGGTDDPKVRDGSDSLVVRYWVQGATNEILARGEELDGCLGTVPAQDPGDPERHILIENEYYLRASPASGDDDYALMCREMVDGSLTTAQPLVEGIESLQLRYGQDSNGDGRPNHFVTAEQITDANDVVAIDIRLVARSSLPVTNDGDYLRHEFNSVIQLRNIAP